MIGFGRNRYIHPICREESYRHRGCPSSPVISKLFTLTDGSGKDMSILLQLRRLDYLGYSSIGYLATDWVSNSTAAVFPSPLLLHNNPRAVGLHKISLLAVRFDKLSFFKRRDRRVRMYYIEGPGLVGQEFEKNIPMERPSYSFAQLSIQSILDPIRG